MPYDFDRIIDRSATSSQKWDHYPGKDILPLWVADMDFCVPNAVISALKERVEHGVFGYTLPPEDLIATIVENLQSRYRWRIHPDWLVWLPGLVSGINVACRSVGAPGDAIMTTIPVYPPFLTAPGHFRRQLQTVALNEDNGRWTFDCERIKKSITRRTRLFLLCSPHNPVGRLFSRKELKALCELLLERDIIICSDEIHCDLILEKHRRHTPAATLSPEIAKRTITLMAPSKTFNIPGLGCAFAVISDSKLRSRFKSAANGIVPGVNALGFTAALAAYRKGGPWLAAVLAYLYRNRQYLYNKIGGISGLSMGSVEATYLAWIDVRDRGIEAPGLFFEKAGVGLSDGKLFGKEGFVRLNFGCPRATLEKALGRMQKAIKKIEG